MKTLQIVILTLFSISASYGQTKVHKEKFNQLEPDVWMKVWDKTNSSKSLQIATVTYDEIPKYIEFRGTVVEALTWTDGLGENLLIQTVTGHFEWKDYGKDSSSYEPQDKAEIYAYLFLKKEGESTFKRVWKVYDYITCFGVDWQAGFIPKATTITDVDADGISEVSMPYVLICRGGMDPGTMKIVLYESDNKYVFRGSTMICVGDNKKSYGGEYKPSANLKTEKPLMDFLKKRWDLHKCENLR